MVTKEEVFNRIKAAGGVPALPEILLELLAACDSDKDLSEIGLLVKKDPALSLQVMRLVNSAYYGLRHTFHKIDQAVVYLGAQTIKNLVATLSVRQVFGIKKFVDSGSFNTRLFWFHSLYCATLAKRIADKLQIINSDEAYLAGLMHDIGKLLLARTFPEQWTQYEAALLTGQESAAAETDCFDVLHQETGAWLVQQWNLNPVVGDAVLYHHEAVEQVAEAFPLVKILFFANLLAIHEAGKGLPAEIVATGEQLLGVDADDLAEICEGAVAEVAQVAETLNIPLPEEAGLIPAALYGQPAVAVSPVGDPALSGLAGETGPDTAGARIETRVQDVTLLTTFLENFLEATTTEELLTIFEEGINLLCGVDKVMFFLPGQDEFLLQASCSARNHLHDFCAGLTFRLQQNSSRIVTAFTSQDKQTIQPGVPVQNLADQQLLSVLGSRKALVLPLVARQGAVGVAVLGMEEEDVPFLNVHGRVLQALAGQLALCLHLAAEEKRRAEELHEERMAAIAATARKFAHELNNPLGIISNYLMTLRLKLQGNDGILEQLSVVDDEIQRMATMIGDMDMYSQAPFSRFEPTDVNEVIKDVIRLIKPSLFAKTGTVLSFVAGSDLPQINTSRDAIKQILINLLKNAVEAMGNTGRAVVRTRKVDAGDPLGVGVEIIVADTGPGLPETVLSKLYEPFVTTKQDGHSGLGLSIIKKAVQQIGGKLNCVSNASKGTTFTIFIRDVHKNTAS